MEESCGSGFAVMLPQLIVLLSCYLKQHLTPNALLCLILHAEACIFYFRET
jgi:hypothetical protein